MTGHECCPCAQPLEESRAECRSNLVDLLREKDRLAEAITDLCWKATPYGGGEYVSAYLLPAGTVHRLIGTAQGVGIPAAFRALPAPSTANPPTTRNEE